MNLEQSPNREEGTSAPRRRGRGTALTVEECIRAPATLPTGPGPQTLAATGTDGRPANPCCTPVAHEVDSRLDSVRGNETTEHPGAADGGSQKPLQIKAFESECDRMGGEERKGPSRIRTGDGGFAILVRASLEPPADQALLHSTPEKQGFPAWLWFVRLWPSLVSDKGKQVRSCEFTKRPGGVRPARITTHWSSSRPSWDRATTGRRWSR
jgi:hypothetical protein